MEGLQNQSLYEKCKKIVKKWEFDFTASKGRVPSKLDIRDADRNIRDAYRTYFRLKTAALMDVINFDEPQDINETCDKNDSISDLSDKNDSITESETTELNQEKEKKKEENVWGKHLNINSEQGVTKLEAKTEKVISTYTKKLFKNSKFMKRNPRSRSSLNLSSRSQSADLSQNNTSVIETLSQPNMNSTETETTEKIITSFNCTLPVVTDAKKSFSQPVSLIDQVLKNSFMLPTRKVDKGWLQRISINTGTSIADENVKETSESNIVNKNNYINIHKKSLNTVLSNKDSDVISGSSDEDDSLSYHAIKRRKLSHNTEYKKSPEVLPPRKDFSNLFSDGSMKSNILISKPDNATNIIKPVVEYNNMAMDTSDIVEEPIKQNDKISTTQNDDTSVMMKQNDRINIIQDENLPVKEVNKKEDSGNDSDYKPEKTSKKVVLIGRKKVGSDNDEEEPKKIVRRGRKKVECDSEDEEPKKVVQKGKKTVESGFEGEEPKKVLRRGRKKVESGFEDKEPKKVVRRGRKKVESGSEDEEPKNVVRRGRKKIQSDSEDESPKKVVRKRKRGEKVAKSPKMPKTPAARKTRGKKIEEKVEDSEPTENDQEEYVIEYSVKPPPTTVPRIKNLPKIKDDTLDIIEEVKGSKELTKKDISESRLQKKIQSGTLNENFVRIDIKKKVYVRGKKHMNFSKYKKNLWKNKKKALHGPEMDMGGCDGGVLTCFRCGQTGHFARQCKAPVDKLLPLEADEEVCPYPSLEEASEMARQSVLAVHKPNIQSQSEKEEPKLAEIVDFEKEENVGKDNSNSDKESEVEVEVSNDECEFEDDEELEAYLANNDIETMKSLQPPIPTWQHIDEEKFVKPLYALNPDGSLQETPKEVFDALQLFGHKSFRPGQEQAVMRILSGKSTLVTLSTGSGKSLCYQLPAYLYAQRSNCISLIISPLVSLMDDQISGMASFLKAACLHTMQTAPQKEKVMKLIDSGELNILLVSPEAVTAGEKMSGFGSLLRKLPPIAFACIDEAHCVSQWSHNFRPSYLMICHVLRERLGINTILGLTATSTFATSSSIVEHLQIHDGQKGIISDIPLPDNLHLSASCDQMRDQSLKNLLTSEPYTEYDSIIVYCTRREECERIASYLRTTIRPKPNTTQLKKYKSLNPVAEPYHAGLASSRRRTVQNAFMGGHLRICVATVAFGMGINKSDIRAVIHYNMPSSFESYVQEVGRSGRDGQPANCHVFLNHEGRDLNELKRHIYANSIDRHVIRKLLQKIFLPCNCVQICPRHEVAFSIQETIQFLDVPEENISTLLCYLELHEKRFIEVLTPAYTLCKIIAYGGSQFIRKAASDCPPLAMALALHKMKEDKKDDNVFEFPVVDVAAAMGWDSGIVKHKLKNLEWVVENNQSKRSKLSVQFTNLGFRLRAPGNLSPFELDETLDNLFAKVKSQEETSLRQLQVVHATLTAISEPFYRNCLTETYSTKASELKIKVREYFSSEDPLKEVKIVDTGECCESQIISDIRCLVSMYRDNNFTGRAVARIFHGIQSPNYPAVIWGRCKFWRAHLNVDFNKVCIIATTEIIRLR